MSADLIHGERFVNLSMSGDRVYRGYAPSITPPHEEHHNTLVFSLVCCFLLVQDVPQRGGFVATESFFLHSGVHTPQLSAVPVSGCLTGPAPASIASCWCPIVDTSRFVPLRSDSDRTTCLSSPKLHTPDSRAHGQKWAQNPYLGMIL